MPSASLTCEGFLGAAAATSIGLGYPNLPVALVDESLTSATAEEKLKASGANARRRDGSLDSLAAAEILATWLELQNKKSA